MIRRPFASMAGVEPRATVSPRICSTETISQMAVRRMGLMLSGISLKNSMVTWDKEKEREREREGEGKEEEEEEEKTAAESEIDEPEYCVRYEIKG
jgi:hypothetical protein